MKEYKITNQSIIIKNKTNLKRSSIVVLLSIAIAAGIIFYFHPHPTLSLFFNKPKLTFHAPILFVITLIILIIMSFNYTLFDGKKRQLLKHTIFGTRDVCNFDEILEIKKIDVYTNTIHSRIKYEIRKNGKQYKNGIFLGSFLPAQHQEIQEFEEKIISAINQLIKKTI